MGLLSHPLIDDAGGLHDVRISSDIGIQTMARHSIKATDRIDVLKAIFNGGDFAKINLRPVPRG